MQFEDILIDDILADNFQQMIHWSRMNSFIYLHSQSNL